MQRQWTNEKNRNFEILIGTAKIEPGEIDVRAGKFGCRHDGDDVLSSLGVWSTNQSPFTLQRNAGWAGLRTGHRVLRNVGRLYGAMRNDWNRGGCILGLGRGQVFKAEEPSFVSGDLSATFVGVLAYRSRGVRHSRSTHRRSHHKNGPNPRAF